MELNEPSEWASLLPRYKYVSKQASGTFGTVYKALDTSSGAIVAIKHIRNIFRHNYNANKLHRELAILS